MLFIIIIIIIITIIIIIIIIIIILLKNFFCAGYAHDRYCILNEEVTCNLTYNWFNFFFFGLWIFQT